MSAPEGIYDVALKPKLLRSLLREYVPDVKHPFSNPSELSYVVSTIKTHKLLSESTVHPADQDLVDAWKSAVDSWVNRLLSLTSSDLPDKCWAGICLLGLTCQECSTERFLTSYADWLNKLLPHIQPSVVSQFVKAASCASLSDMFTRLSGYSNAKKDGTSLATKVTQLAIELFNEDSSAVVMEEAICLLCTLISFFPLSVHRHYDSVEAAIVSKLVSGKCCASVLKKLSYGLSLLPRSKGDEESWSLMMDKILLYVNSQLNDAFQGLEEEDRNAQTMRAVLPPGKEPPLPLGGLAVSEQNSDISTRRPERLLGSRVSTLLQCCCNMLTSSYPVMVPVPVRGLIAVAGRVLLVDGSLSLSSYSFMTTLKQEFICSEIPLLQLHSLEVLQAVAKGLSSQLLPHLAHIVELLKEYLGRCKFPDMKIKAYSILKVLLMSMGVGLAIHVSQDIVNNIFIDLDFLGNEKDGKSPGSNTKVQPGQMSESHRKKRKLSTVAGSFQEQPAHDGLEAEMPNMTPIPVKIAALEALEALLTMGGSIRSESWRGNVDHLLISVTSYACKGGLSKEERKILLSGSMSTWGDFQLAALRALLASLLSPGRVRPSHLALGLELFRRGTQETGTKVAEYCGHALLALEVLIHPRALPLSDQHSSIDDYNVLSHKLRDSVYHKGDRQIVEPESEDDDLYEKWVENDDEMETQVTEGHHLTATDASPNELPSDKVCSSAHITGRNETTVLGNCPSEKGMANSDDCMVEFTSDQREPVFQTTGLVEMDTIVKGDAVSTSEQRVSGSADDGFSTIVERISATLTNAERSKAVMYESDKEDSLPDIVDGDPDSD